MTLVDSNVLLDLVTDDERWANWSQAQLEQAATAGRLFVNSVIYAEISTRRATVETVDEMLRNLNIEIAPIPRTAFFLAGKAYLRFRAVLAPVCCPTFSLAPMRQSSNYRCRRAMCGAIAAIFRRS